MLPSRSPGPERSLYRSVVECANSVCAPPRCPLHPLAQIDSYRVYFHGSSPLLLIFHSARRCLYLIPGGAARRNSQIGRTARRRQGRARGLARLREPLPPSTVVLSDQHQRAAEMGIRYRFPVVSLRALLLPPRHHDSAADHPISGCAAILTELRPSAAAGASECRHESRSSR